MAMIKLEHVNKYFGDLHVLKDINLEVAEGEKLVIIGPSGSGKSTTVRCMNFLEEPSSGKVYLDGKELNHKNKVHLIRETTSMVFQQFNLYPHMTVLRNLTLAPTKLYHKSKTEAEKLAYHYLDVVGLRDKAHVYPTTLSGGQQQRIAIARALCAQTKIILFDEPTSALDPETIQEVLDVMIRLAKENITMVVVTHEMGFARQVADRIVFMADGQIVEEGTPEHFFENPENERVKQFLGKIIGEIFYLLETSQQCLYMEYILLPHVFRYIPTYGCSAYICRALPNKQAEKRRCYEKETGVTIGMFDGCDHVGRLR